jgi:hypothetical protein
LRKATLLLIILCNLIFSKLLAQEYQKQDIDFQSFIQNIVGIPTDNLNYDELLEALGQLYSNPIDLNTANHSQLASLFVLTDKQINSILNYREKSGLFASIYELQAVEGLELSTIYKILPFVIVRQPGISINGIETSLNKANHTLFLRSTNILEQKKGYTPLKGRETVRYLGKPGGLLVRYKLFHTNDISAGFTLDKDDGEGFTFNPKKNQYLADFTSFHFQVQNKGRWKSINLGDYTMQFGQGLVLSSGFYLGKGAETILAVRRNSLGIRPYTSVIENNFFRGAAATYQTGAFEITGFFARNRRTANLVTDKATNTQSISSIDTDGYHRTQSEIDDKASLTEQNVGINIKWKNKNDNLQIEATALDTHYDLPILKQDRPYNQYEFKGKNQQVGSLSYSYIVSNLNLFGEIARSKSKGIGTVNGLLLSLSKKSDLAFVYRNYAKNFHSFYANGFGENSRNINENGAYIGYKFSPNRRWIYTSSFDYFKFPEIKFGVDGPSDGLEFLHRISYSPTKTTHWHIQYREQHKEKNFKIENTNKVINSIKRNLIFDLETPFSAKIIAKTRLMASSYNFEKQPKSYGFAIVQDAQLKLNKVNIDARIAYFNTDDFDNRQYVYEQDVLYAFSFPAYFNKGLRHYLLMTYKLTKAAEIQVRWARTDYFDQTSISSGLEEIAKPHKSEIKMQLKLNW